MTLLGRLCAAFALGLLAVAPPVSAQEKPGRELCGEAQSFLSDGFGMVVELEVDSIADPRTNLRLPGCRVTAAGGTSFNLGETASLLFDQLGGEGWSRTPTPRDMDARGARRLRKEGVDCLFWVYQATIETIGPAAQVRVNRAFHPYDREQRYNVLVQCVPALPPAF